MKKTFLLAGLDCPNCAAEIERSVRAIDGVTDASVSFITTKMTIEAAGAQMDEVVKKAKKIARRVEHDVEIKEI